MKDFYQRHLPHFQPEEATYFITFRLKDSLPKQVLIQLQEEKELEKRILQREKNALERSRKIQAYQKRYFGHFVEFLDGASKGPFWLNISGIASIVSEAIHYRDSSVYNLQAFCIMPNHVHLIFKPFPRSAQRSVGRRASSPYIATTILENLKWYTALQANRILGRRGAFWQHESYDHVVREDELVDLVRYVIENPVKAGLVKHWQNWRWTYVKESLVTEFEL